MRVRSALSAGAHCDSKVALRAGDDGANDLLVREVILADGVQVWFMAEHLVDVLLARAD